MILGVDVGGTKTLLGLFNSRGRLVKTHRALTNDRYPDFIKNLSLDIQNFTENEDLESITIAMPGTINRKNQSVISLGHRPWKNIPIVDDLRDHLKFTGKILLENDAKLAGLAEAQPYKKRGVVVYVTISTGIGLAIVIDGVLDKHFIGDEGGFMVVPHEGKLRFWDHIASGAAFKENYGALAEDVDDPKIWKEHSRVLVPGFSAIHALLTPDLIITGGGLGAQLEKFREPLVELLSLPGSLVSKMPDFVAAKHGQDSVLFGCYELAKQSA